MLMAWLQSLITAATTGSPALRLPMYDFLETTTFYPPEPEDAAGSGSERTTSATAIASPAAPGAAGIQGFPVATATPYVETVGGAFPATAPPDAATTKISYNPGGDGWLVPIPSRETSDVKMAMAGPDTSGKLTAAAVAEVLKTGTGASTEDLRTVWELSDIDEDGKLDREEVR